MHFTADGDRLADCRVSRDLGVIALRLVGALGDAIQALVLGGAFGRGEGAIPLIDGQQQPANDYDVFVILRQASQVNWTAVGRRLAKDVGIAAIDLIPIVGYKLPTLPFTMFNYDLKYGGYVFWGDQQVLSLIPEMDSMSMPVTEGETLLFNRCVSLLECLPDVVPTALGSQAEIHWIAYQSSKVILACCDARLLLERLYHTKYREKCRRFVSHQLGDQSDAELIRFATAYKLTPDPERISDPLRLWSGARRLYVQTLIEVARRQLGSDISSIQDLVARYERQLIRDRRIVLRRVKRLLLFRDMAVDWRLRTDMAGVLLAASLDDEFRVHEGLLDACRYQLGKLPGASVPVITWHEARRRYVDWWYNLHDMAGDRVANGAPAAAKAPSTEASGGRAACG